MKTASPLWKKLLLLAGVLSVILSLSVVGVFKLGLFDSATEKHLRSALAEPTTTVTLPAQISGSTWQEALIVCPYTDAAAVPAAYQTTLENFSTQTESFNWVLYKLSDGTVIDHEVSRKTADFCRKDVFIEVTPKCEFTVENLGAGQGTVLTPKC
ncbi:MAG: hypothetical protein Q4D73_01035 [Actinomycetaceae bacterium]|nr:hypothetical protein [Actinomycetaceae bacterium]